MEQLHFPERQTRTVDDILLEARAKLPHRPSPQEAYAMTQFGAKIIDIRRFEQRVADGDIPGAILIHRNEFEWRCDPSSSVLNENILPNNYEQVLLILCNQGYQSSLAGAELQELGMVNVTDIDGGFEAWRDAGLPIIPAVCELPINLVRHNIHTI